jgi:serine/threonine-protein phosphatase 2B regulatory subunit
MGCGYSDAFTHAFATPQFQEWNKTWTALRITKQEIYKLFKKYQKVDLDKGGTIDVVELLTVLDVERTRFTERVFSIFDEDQSGKIDFNEFVLSLWNYCTLTRVTLGMFAFDLYDRDSSGLLEEKDIIMMLRDIYGKKAETGHYARQ